MNDAIAKYEETVQFYMNHFGCSREQACRSILSRTQDILKNEFKISTPLDVLLKLHNMYEQQGDAMSRYAHEVRAVLRQNGLLERRTD
jgi:hypothetical protein